MLLEAVEITVVVEEHVSLPEAEGGDPAVNRLADGDSHFAEGSVVVGRDQGQISSSRWQDLEGQEVLPYAGSLASPRTPWSTSQRVISVSATRWLGRFWSSQSV